MPRSTRALLALLLLAAALPLQAACGGSSGPLMSDLRLSSPVLAPTGRGDVPPLAVGYALSRPATVTAYLTPATGEKLYLRRDEVRPVAGEYRLAFNGAYAPDPAGEERRVLPSGDYRLVVEARDASGLRQESAARVQVTDADTAPPAIENLALFPETISPNADGVDDATRITYRTTKKATVTLYIQSASGKRHVLERREHRAPGEHASTWDGQVGDRLLPSGDYRLSVVAEDAAGNVTVAGKGLRVDSASVPDAHLFAVSFEPRRVLPGGTVRVEIRVKNTGNTVLKTQGPDPGYTYASAESFATIQGGAFRDQRGLWRVGVDWSATASGPPGSRYPYRWGFGKDLQPGEEATVVGYLRLEQPYPRIWLHAGLVQEQVRYWDNEVGRAAVEIAN